MDFALYARVLWRFRLLVAVGMLSALTLALLSLVRVSADGLTYRQSELWSASIRLLVTQAGFPEGRLYAETPTDGTEKTPEPGAPIADPARFNALAILYSQLATSDPVRRQILRGGPLRGRIAAQPLRDEQSGTLLPLIDLTALAKTPRDAIVLAQRAAGALDTYIGNQQRAHDVPATDRVVLQPIVQPREAELYQPRSKTMAIVVFLAVMLATCGLAFLLENAKPRERELDELPDASFRRSEQQRTA